MPRAKETEGQYAINDYKLKQVDVRLKLMDGPAYYSSTPVASPEDAAAVMRDVLKELDREWVCVVNLDNHLKPVNFNVVSIGSVNASLAPIQNIMKSAMLSNCSSIMLFHNHPSGEVMPSREDQQLTKRLVEAAKLMDMVVVDHLIVGGQTGDLYSFRQHDPELFRNEYIDLDYIHGMERAADSKTSYRTGAGKTAGGKPDAKDAIEARRAEMKQITDKLEKGVADIFTSEKFQAFLNCMAKFPQYSLNNNLLIMLQKPDASLVQSFTGWKKMGRFVKRGEKGIRILAPTPYQIDREQNKLDEDGRTILDKDGEPIRETVQLRITAFKPVSTFDISQTEGEPIPTIGVDELRGSVDHYTQLFEAIRQASPVPIAFEEIKGSAKGYFHTEENRIAIKAGMDEIQTVKTAIHEMAHATLHNKKAQEAREGGKQTTGSKEVEAESVAYTVCQHYGIDTSDYSFAYVAGWSAGKELPELKESLQTIRDASAEIIAKIDEKMEELSKGQDHDKEAVLPVAAPEKTERSRPEEKKQKPSVITRLAEGREKTADMPHIDALREAGIHAKLKGQEL